MDRLFENIGVLVPAYNAGNTLGSLIERLSPYVPTNNVLVVDDGSTDNTAAIGRQRGVRVLSLGKNRGKGAALSKGFEVWKNDPSFESIMTIDADLQHPPEKLPAFVEMKLQSGADIVVGARNRRGTNMPIHRRLSNTITSMLVSVRTGENILDSQCGFRLIGTHVLSAVSLESNGYEAETEFLIKAVKKGFAVRFVPIETIYNGEKSHMTNWKTTINFIKILLQDYS